MAVHGKYDQPCPVCDSPVQRIRYAANECNYCATCQTAGSPDSSNKIGPAHWKTWKNYGNRTRENTKTRRGVISQRSGWALAVRTG
jgi:hypothetical protein